MEDKTNIWQFFAISAVAWAIFIGIVVSTPVWFWSILLVLGFFYIMVISINYYLLRKEMEANKNDRRTKNIEN